MRMISVAVSDSDYEAYHKAAKEQNRSADQLIREAVVFFRAHKLEHRERLVDLPVLAGHRPRKDLPSRTELYQDLYDDAEPKR